MQKPDFEKATDEELGAWLTYLGTESMTAVAELARRHPEIPIGRFVEAGVDAVIKSVGVVTGQDARRVQSDDGVH